MLNARLVWSSPFALWRLVVVRVSLERGWHCKERLVMKNKMLRLFRVVPALLCLAVASFIALVNEAMAQAADATTIITQAETAFEAVSVLVVAIVAFFIIVRIVKKVRG